MYFLPLLESGSLRSRCQHDQVLVRTLPHLLPVSSHALSLIFAHRDQERSFSPSSYKSTDPIGLGPMLILFNLNLPPKALCPNTVTLGGQDFNIWILRGHNSDHNRHSFLSKTGRGISSQQSAAQVLRILSLIEIVLPHSKMIQTSKHQASFILTGIL